MRAAIRLENGRVAAVDDGRKGQVTCVRLTDEQRSTFIEAAKLRHERLQAEHGNYYADGTGADPWRNRSRWTPMGVGEYMRTAALEEAKREIERAKKKAPAAKKKGGAR